MAAPYEGQIFRTYASFDDYMKAYCDATAQTFVVDDSRRIESHAKYKNETQLKYCFVRLTCVKYGSKQIRKNRPLGGKRPN